MLVLQGISYTHPDKDSLFTNLSLTVAKGEKVAIVGNNGAGKSTLLQIVAGKPGVTAGLVKTDSAPYYIPQLADQYNELTVAQALGIGQKIGALRAILEGQTTALHFAALDDDWGIEERCAQAFKHWALTGVRLDQEMNTLSGGQKTKVLLAGIDIHQPALVLMDEPSNHLDNAGKSILYEYITTARTTLILVSHDRTLLNLVAKVFELDKNGISTYAGNYEFYRQQKTIAQHALAEDLQSKEKELRKAREVARAEQERQQKLDARGRKKQEKAGMPTIMMHTMRNNAENSTAKTKTAHEKKTGSIQEELQELRNAIPDADKIKMNLDNSWLHKGKILFKLAGVNVCFERALWRNDLSIEINSGERLAIKGPNGSGKTTLAKLLMGTLQPDRGTIERAPVKMIYIDQDYTLLDHRLTVYQQAQTYNSSGLAEHEVNIRLSRFLFTRNTWDRPCGALSGGERMRLLLCCLSIAQQAPDVILLDEPTNNLDLQNVEILTAALNDYKGTLIIISHDEDFTRETGIYKFLEPGELM